MLEGMIAITGLPPHRGMIVRLCFYRVDLADAPAPYGGDPPVGAATDCHEVVKHVDLNAESSQGACELPFRVARPAGFYYLQVRAILFRAPAGEVFAQAEQFFFGRRPVHVAPEVAPEEEGVLTLPVSWPTQSLEELHTYGTMSPRTKRQWWRFW